MLVPVGGRCVAFLVYEILARDSQGLLSRLRWWVRVPASYPTDQGGFGEGSPCAHLRGSHCPHIPRQCLRNPRRPWLVT